MKMEKDFLMSRDSDTVASKNYHLVDVAINQTANTT